MLLRRVCSASQASWAAWRDAGGRPPRVAERDSGVMAPSWVSSLPFAVSVRSEAQAMEAVQPRQRNFICCTTPFSIIAERWRMSPQTGLVTSTDEVALGSGPALRGFWK